jgi:hypothetical protein
MELNALGKGQMICNTLQIMLSMVLLEERCGVQFYRKKGW